MSLVCFYRKLGTKNSCIVDFECEAADACCQCWIKDFTRLDSNTIEFSIQVMNHHNIRHETWWASSNLATKSIFDCVKTHLSNVCIWFLRISLKMVFLQCTHCINLWIVSEFHFDWVNLWPRNHWLQWGRESWLIQTADTQFRCIWWMGRWVSIITSMELIRRIENQNLSLFNESLCYCACVFSTNSRLPQSS